MPGLMSAPNGNHALTIRASARVGARTGKTEIQRGKGKAKHVLKRGMPPAQRRMQNDDS